jgi:hypothetical protein
MRFLCEQLLYSFDRGIHVNVIDCQKIKPINCNEYGYYKASLKSRFLPSRIVYTPRKTAQTGRGILNCILGCMREIDLLLAMISGLVKK